MRSTRALRYALLLLILPACEDPDHLAGQALLDQVAPPEYELLSERVDGDAVSRLFASPRDKRDPSALQLPESFGTIEDSDLATSQDDPEGAYETTGAWTGRIENAECSVYFREPVGAETSRSHVEIIVSCDD